MTLSIITVTYNDEKVIVDFLTSLRESEVEKGGIETEVLLVDNHSSDRTVEIVRESVVEINLTVLDENVGFSAANNVALAKSHGDVVLFLNPDTKFSTGVFKTLLKYLDTHVEVGALTCRVLLPDGADDLNTRRNFPTPWSALKHFLHLPGGSYYLTGREDEEQDIPACGGSFLMVRRQVLDQIGGWDEEFFLYGEDLDLCYRIREAGWKIMYVPTVSITHFGGVSTGIKKSGLELSTASKEQKRKMAGYSVEAMAHFYRKHLSKKHSTIMNLLVEFGFKSLRFLREVQFSF